MGNPMNTYTHNTHRNAAFTLIEILIVVVILGILAAVVIVQISGMRADAERSAFISSGQIFQEAAYRYFLDNGAFPPDRRSGRLPDGFGDYITSQSWERLTPIDGLWDMEADSYGLTPRPWASTSRAAPATGRMTPTCRRSTPLSTMATLPPAYSASWPVGGTTLSSRNEIARPTASTRSHSATRSCCSRWSCR